MLRPSKRDRLKLVFIFKAAIAGAINSFLVQFIFHHKDYLEIVSGLSRAFYKELKFANATTFTTRAFATVASTKYNFKPIRRFFAKI